MNDSIIHIVDTLRTIVFDTIVHNTFVDSAPKFIEAQSSDSTMDNLWVGAIGGFLAAFLVKYVIVWINTCRIKCEQDKEEGNHGNLRIYNGSFASLNNVVAYITIFFNGEEDIIPKAVFNPNGSLLTAFIDSKSRTSKLIEDRICWAVTVPVWNPHVVNILPKEKQKTVYR